MRCERSNMLRHNRGVHLMKIELRFFFKLKRYEDTENTLTTFQNLLFQNYKKTSQGEVDSFIQMKIQMIMWLTLKKRSVDAAQTGIASRDISSDVAHEPVIVLVLMTGIFSIIRLHTPREIL